MMTKILLILIRKVVSSCLLILIGLTFSAQTAGAKTAAAKQAVRAEHLIAGGDLQVHGMETTCAQGLCIAAANTPAGASPMLTAVDLGRAVGRPGGLACLPAILSSGPVAIGGVSNDITFDPTLLAVNQCRINPNIGPGSIVDKQLAAASVNDGVQRVGVFGLGLSPVPDGLLYTCEMEIAPSATNGQMIVGNVPSASDTVGNEVSPIGGAAGAITVTSCTSDCNGNNIVTISELVRAVNLFFGQPLCHATSPGLSCPVADADNNGAVSIDEIVQAVNRFLAGCPPTPTPLVSPTSAHTPTELPSPTPSFAHSPTVTETPTTEGANTATPTATSTLQVPDVTRLLDTSPAGGDAGVAISRETILQFNGALDPESVSVDSIRATFGPEDLITRLHVSPDQAKVTIFYPGWLPASARVRVRVDGELLRDSVGRAVDADGDGVPGGLGVFDFDTLTLTTLSVTRVCGRVFASELAPADMGMSVNVPLDGVRITVDGREDELFALTDAMGNFCLDPAPVGEFFVHIDGYTAIADLPAGAYYPFVGKKWRSRPGEESSIGNVFLPLIVPGTLQPVSATEETRITFPASVLGEHPELEGVHITVPADALYADNGTRGGMVGIAPVPPDRLPGGLPAVCRGGLREGRACDTDADCGEGTCETTFKFPLVITVQTDGPSNFDRPVPICFPNLPDPDTGEPLAPGEASALWSFNHDTGEFEISGPMTVTEDGTLVCTDPGVGVPAPGWHGRGQNNPGDGPEKPECPVVGGGGPLPRTASCAQCKDSPAPSCPEFKRPNVWALLQEGFRLIGRFFKNVKRYSEIAVKIVKVKQALDALNNELKAILGDVRLVCINGPHAGRVCGQNADCDGGECARAIDKLQARARALAVQAAKDRISKEVADDIETSGGLLVVLQAAFEGAENVLSELEASCAPVSSSPCCFSDFAKFSCVQISIFRNAVALARATLENVDKTFGELALIPICNAIDEALARLDEGEGSAVGREARGAAIANDPVLALEDAVEQFELFIAEFEQINQVLQTWIEDAPALERNAQLLNDAVGDYFLQEQGEVFPAFALVEYGEVSIRSQTTGDTFRFTLPPDTPFVLSIISLDGTACGTTVGRSPLRAGVPFRFHGPVMSECLGADLDGDGLTEQAEVIIGTGPFNVDTDGDGVSDGAEIRNGTDPLDGVPQRIGILATAPVPGIAADVCAVNGLVAVAGGSSGVSVFNAFNGMDPRIIALVNTPGTAQAVACGTGVVAVADGTSGLAIVDLADPPAARIRRQVTPVELGGSAQSVAIAGDTAYVGTADGTIAVVDLVLGIVLERLTVGAAVHDLAIDGEMLYAITPGVLRVLPLFERPLAVAATVATPGGAVRWRVSAGVGRAYVTHRRGYNIIDISNPRQPAAITNTTTPQFGWKQLAPNGSGYGVAAVSPNEAFDGPHNVGLYDLRNPAVTGDRAFVSEIETPGVARAVAIFNGLAYVADHNRGLHVVNYLAADLGTQPPDVSFRTNLPALEVEEETVFLVDASVVDDVQVRNVELLVDGRVAQRDGSFPFQFFVRAPRLFDQASFDLAVRATDTGGNSTTTESVTLTILPETTPPVVLDTLPRDGATVLSLSRIVFELSEPIVLAQLQAGPVEIVHQGDGTRIAAADVRMVVQPNGTARVSLDFDIAVPSGTYRLDLSAESVVDAAGNTAAEPVSITFTNYVLGVDGPAPGAALIAGSIVRLTVGGFGGLGGHPLSAAHFYINGVEVAVDTSAPYSYDFPVPLSLGATSVMLTVVVRDQDGNVGTITNQLTFTVISDPGTTVVGRVVDSHGNPVANAQVITRDRTAQTGVGGDFIVPGMPTIHGDILVYVVVTIGDTELAGSGHRAPVRGGTTDIGDITVDDRDWLPGFGIPGASREVHALAVHANDLYVAGGFTEIGDAVANRVAKWDGTSWSALGSGVNGYVYALVVDGAGNVFVGGDFSQAGNEEAHFVAKWDGTTWSALGSGVNDWVYALAVDGAGNVYAAGDFDQAGGASANRVAKWDGTSWSALNSGMDGYVAALVLDGAGVLYAGGGFSEAGEVQANNVAKWDGISWSALDSGVNDAVYSLAVNTVGNVYAGGEFTQAGGVSAPYLAKWDGMTWSSVGSGVNGSVASIAVNEAGAVHVGGTFSRAGGTAVNRVAKWDGTSWSALGSGMDERVRALALDGSGKLYAGGGFVSAGGATAWNLAKWNGASWSAFPFGVDDLVYTLAVDPVAGVYVGGGICEAGGVLTCGVVRWNGTSWSALGSGMDSDVYALAVDGTGSVYAGGVFSEAGGVPANLVAKWNGTNWSALGLGVDDGVFALVAGPAGGIYAGGDFSEAGGAPASRVAKWDGTTWSALGSGVNSGVLALAVDEAGNLYAGGWFTEAGDAPANYVAKWNGASWSALGAGVNDRVLALAVDEAGNLYAGGWFTEAGGVTVNHVAKWDGTSWSALGLGLNSGVSALAIDDRGDVYAGGYFSEADGTPAKRLAKWDGTSWSSLGSGGKNGVNSFVNALGVDRGRNVYVGGAFERAGERISTNFAVWGALSSTSGGASLLSANGRGEIGLSSQPMTTAADSTHLYRPSRVRDKAAAAERGDVPPHRPERRIVRSRTRVDARRATRPLPATVPPPAATPTPTATSSRPMPVQQFPSG